MGPAMRSSVTRAAMDLALLQVMASGNDYLDRIGALSLEPTQRLGESIPGVLSAYADVTRQPAYRGRSMVRPVGGKVTLDLRMMREICLQAMGQLLLDPTRDRDVKRGGQKILLSSRKRQQIHRNDRIRPPPDTPRYLYGLQWVLEMYDFNRVRDLGYHHPNYVHDVRGLVADLTLMVGALAAEEQEKQVRAEKKEEEEEEKKEREKEMGGMRTPDPRSRPRSTDPESPPRASAAPSDPPPIRLEEVTSADLAVGKEMLARWRAWEEIGSRAAATEEDAGVGGDHESQEAKDPEHGLGKGEAERKNVIKGHGHEGNVDVEVDEGPRRNG